MSRTATFSDKDGESVRKADSGIQKTAKHA